MAQSRLVPVGEEPIPSTVVGVVETVPPHAEARVQSALTSLLAMSLKTLSQKTIVALAALIDLALLGSAFALWLLVIGDPSTPQLIAVAGYALFTLIALYMRNHRS